QSAAADPKATPKVLWDALFINVFSTDTSSAFYNMPEVQTLLGKLVVMGDPSGRFQYLSTLQTRRAQARVRKNDGSIAELAALPPDELNLMLTAYNGLRSDAKKNNSGSLDSNFVSLVTEELRRAGKTAEEQEIYRSIIDKAQSAYDLGNAITIAGTR